MATKITTANITSSDLATLRESIESLETKTGATGTVVHDYSTSNIWVHTSISSNFTANFINIPTTDNKIINLCLILVQGATAYLPNVLQIDGIAQTIRWFDGITIIPTANRRELVTFTLIRTSSTWTVLGALSSFG